MKLMYVIMAVAMIVIVGIAGCTATMGPSIAQGNYTSGGPMMAHIGSNSMTLKVTMPANPYMSAMTIPPVSMTYPMVVQGGQYTITTPTGALGLIPNGTGFDMEQADGAASVHFIPV